MSQLAFSGSEGKNSDFLSEKEYRNQLETKFLAIPENEQLARLLVSAFLAPLDPTLEELNDIKTAVSEAVTNAIIHGYPDKNGEEYVYLNCKMNNRKITIIIRDEGVGIEDLSLAMEPLYTSKPELERSGMGFSFMEAFMDEINVSTKVGEGVTVSMTKVLNREEERYG